MRRCRSKHRGSVHSQVSVEEGAVAAAVERKQHTSDYLKWWGDLEKYREPSVSNTFRTGMYSCAGKELENRPCLVPDSTGQPPSSSSELQSHTSRTGFGWNACLSHSLGLATSHMNLALACTTAAGPVSHIQGSRWLP